MPILRWLSNATAGLAPIMNTVMTSVLTAGVIRMTSPTAAPQAAVPPDISLEHTTTVAAFLDEEDLQALRIMNETLKTFLENAWIRYVFSIFVAYPLPSILVGLLVSFFTTYVIFRLYMWPLVLIRRGLEQQNDSLATLTQTCSHIQNALERHGRILMKITGQAEHMSSTLDQNGRVLLRLVNIGQVLQAQVETLSETVNRTSDQVLARIGDIGQILHGQFETLSQTVTQKSGEVLERTTEIGQVFHDRVDTTSQAIAQVFAEALNEVNGELKNLVDLTNGACNSINGLCDVMSHSVNNVLDSLTQEVGNLSNINERIYENNINEVVPGLKMIGTCMNSLSEPLTKSLIKHHQLHSECMRALRPIYRNIHTGKLSEKDHFEPDANGVELMIISPEATSSAHINPPGTEPGVYAAVDPRMWDGSIYSGEYATIDDASNNTFPKPNDGHSGVTTNGNGTAEVTGENSSATPTGHAAGAD